MLSEQESSHKRCHLRTHGYATGADRCGNSSQFLVTSLHLDSVMDQLMTNVSVMDNR